MALGGEWRLTMEIISELLPIEIIRSNEWRRWKKKISFAEYVLCESAMLVRNQ